MKGWGQDWHIIDNILQEPEDEQDDGASEISIVGGKSVVVTHPEKVLPIEEATIKALGFINISARALESGKVDDFVVKASEAISLMIPHKP